MRLRFISILGPLAVAFALPFIVRSPYLLGILILIGIYVVLALTYDLVTGHVGMLSFAHPAFFGIGAYVTAILSLRFGTPFVVNVAVAALAAGALSLLIGIPSFRLSRYAFAMGTLGFAVMVQSVAQNWIELTAGPQCLFGVAPPSIPLPFLPAWNIATLTDFYYLLLAIVAVTAVVYARLVDSRIGRSFAAIREHEHLAQTFGINPLQYKMVAFAAGAVIVGCVGSFYVEYISVICPVDLSADMTVQLLVMVYIGGIASMRGAVLGAVIFVALPEILNVSQQFRLVIYGILLYLAIVLMPEGISGLLRKASSRFGRRPVTDADVG